MLQANRVCRCCRYTARMISSNMDTFPGYIAILQCLQIIAMIYDWYKFLWRILNEAKSTDYLILLIKFWDHTNVWIKNFFWKLHLNWIIAIKSIISTILKANYFKAWICYWSKWVGIVTLFSSKRQLLKTALYFRVRGKPYPYHQSKNSSLFTRACAQ